MPWPSAKPADADAPASTPGKRHIRLPLDNPAQMRSALARLIRLALNDRLPTEQLSRYANAISILHRIATDTDLEALKAEVAAIERRLPA